MTEAMKPGFSSMNPYAAAYILLSRRDPTQRTSIPGNVWPGNSGEIAQNQYQRNASYGSGAHITGEHYGSSSQSVNELVQKQLLDEQFDMELEYLKMTSDQSLPDVYVANRGDLDATIDMLNQLESLELWNMLENKMMTLPWIIGSPCRPFRHFPSTFLVSAQNWHD